MEVVCISSPLLLPLCLSSKKLKKKRKTQKGINTLGEQRSRKFFLLGLSRANTRSWFHGSVASSAALQRWHPTWAPDCVPSALYSMQFSAMATSLGPCTWRSSCFTASDQLRLWLLGNFRSKSEDEWCLLCVNLPF